jgi:ABC-type uncharacterized transport system involved in gliding motility auxiliary subunit
MDTKWRRYAPVGLYLALLALVAAGVLFIVQREWNIYLQVSLALVVGGLAVYGLLDPDALRKALTGRQARYGSNALVLSIAVIGILVVVNFLLYNNSKRWDLTEDQQNTLASETLLALEKLESPVQAQAFFTARISSDRARTLLDQYKFNSDGKFEYTFIDPDADPISAQQENITLDGTVVLKMGERRELLSIVTEKEITGGLVRLMNTESVGIYFLTGHGERSPIGTDDTALSKVMQALEAKGYKVEQLNLLADRNIPEDARVILVAGATRPVSQDEMTLLDNFLQAGGSLIVMEEPLPLTEFGDQPDLMADYLNQTWGIESGKDIIVDLTSDQPFVAYTGSYADHAITQRMQGLGSYFPTARSIHALGDNPGYTQTELAFTSEQAWAEIDLAAVIAQQEISPQEGERIGSVPMIVLVESSASSGNRLAVFGDVDFASDGHVDNYGNGDLIVNTIDWAAEQENLINLTPKTPTQRVMLPPQRYTMGLLLFGSVFLLPGLVLVAAVAVWIQRRKRG